MPKRTKSMDDERARRKPRDKSLRVGRTPVGRGLFAQQRYSVEDLIGEVAGEVIDDANYSSDYCMDMGDTRCLEPAAPFRYMNHSCEPNCRFHWYDVADDSDPNLRRRIFVFAIQQIEIGDELTIDYAWPASMAIVCQCNSPNCRGWVVDASVVADVVDFQHPRGYDFTDEKSDTDGPAAILASQLDRTSGNGS